MNPEADRAAETGPASDPASAPTSTHEAPVLAEALGALQSSGPRRVLDAGPASGRNLECYSEIAAGVRFLGLGGAATGALRDLDEAAFRCRLDELLPIGRESFNLVLLWTVLDYLEPTQAGILCRHVSKTARPGARLHAMVSTSSVMPASPDRFEIAEPGVIIAVATSSRLTQPPGTAPAQVERWLRPFEVERSILLRHGVREILAIRR